MAYKLTSKKRVGSGCRGDFEALEMQVCALYWILLWLARFIWIKGQFCSKALRDRARMCMRVQ